MKELTEKQKKVLNFIKEFHAQNAMMPTVREIATNFKLSNAFCNAYLVRNIEPSTACSASKLLGIFLSGI